MNLTKALLILLLLPEINGCGFLRGKASRETFSSNAEIEQKTQVDCLLPFDLGKGDDKISLFGFDLATKACIPFTYGGRGGNSNQFKTLEDCQETCEGKPIYGYVGYDANHVLVHCPIPPDDLICTQDMQYPEDYLPPACLKVEGQVSRCGCHYYLCTENTFIIK